jgi:thiol-disulfide isomerase/thioredoxin
MKRLIAPLVLVAGVAVALIASVGSAREAPAGPPPPGLTLERLDADGEFALNRLEATDTPTLLWIWAPWCPYCNEEAATIERLAADNRGELTVVSIGGSDSREAVMAFVDEHGLRTPTLLFDEAMGAADHYRLASVPSAVLLDRTGRERKRWNGVFDTAEALAAARDL